MFSYDGQTGEIAVNPDYPEVSAVFDLPLDASLANLKKAEIYLADILGSSRRIDEQIARSSLDSGIACRQIAQVKRETGFPASLLL